MRTKKAKRQSQSMYVFLGGSITSRDAREAAEIADRVRLICRVLDRLGHRYDANILTDTAVHRDAKEKPEMEIPAKYLKGVSRAVVESIRGLRVKNDPYDLKEEIACYQWSLDLLEKCGAGIWDITKSSTGSGFEIATAMLLLRKPCLVLFDRPTVSTMMNGCTSRLLTVRQWDEHIESEIEKFLVKAGRGLDHPVKFNADSEMIAWLKDGMAARGIENQSEYLRYLIEEDRRRLSDLEDK